MELGLETSWAPPVICMQHSMGAPNTPEGPQGSMLLVQTAAEEREVEVRLGGCPAGSTGLGRGLRQERPRRNSIFAPICSPLKYTPIIHLPSYTAAYIEGTLPEVRECAFPFQKAQER